MIQWRRLMRVIRDTLSDFGVYAVVEIHLTTDMPDDIRANIQGDGSRFDILLSAGDNKGIDSILESVAHELAHAVLFTNRHDKPTQEAILTKLKEGMYVSVQ